MADTKLKLGVMMHIRDDAEGAIGKVADIGVPTAQLGWPPNMTVEQGVEVKRIADYHGVEITTLWASLPGLHVWNFIEGPTSIGLVPEAWRAQRVQALEQAARCAAEMGVQSITTHCGFIPEFPGDPLYQGVVVALKQVMGTCDRLGVEFWFETGQETPITLLRTIQDVGSENMGINLDPANLLMYGKANPVDALDTFGEWVRGVHAKDGDYPTDGDSLGKEKPLGEGKVNFPVLVPKLKACGFTGALTIEREISGDKQIEDIKKGIDLLTPLL
jgi:L-ribulose-5-phosphate 3-epimerase